jgi:hypothetical protein
MIHTVILYLIITTAPNMYTTKQYTNYEIFSTIPIKECSAYIKINKMTNEKSMVHYCKPEVLYSYMTGQGDFEITVNGVYKL